MDIFCISLEDPLPFSSNYLPKLSRIIIYYDRDSAHDDISRFEENICNSNIDAYIHTFADGRECDYVTIYMNESLRSSSFSN